MVFCLDKICDRLYDNRYEGISPLLPLVRFIQKSTMYSFEYRFLFFGNCRNRTTCRTSTTTNASISIDDVGLVAFGNSRNGTTFCTRTAFDAVATNYICHITLSFLYFANIIVTHTFVFVKWYFYFFTTV